MELFLAYSYGEKYKIDIIKIIIYNIQHPSGF